MKHVAKQTGKGNMSDLRSLQWKHPKTSGRLIIPRMMAISKCWSEARKWQFLRTCSTV